MLILFTSKMYKYSFQKLNVAAFTQMPHHISNLMSFKLDTNISVEQPICVRLAFLLAACIA